MLPTPSTSHVNTDRIYEPAEDSFLFLNTLSSKTEIRFLKDRFLGSIEPANGTTSPPLILEVGTGSGVVLAFLTAHAQEIFGRGDILSLGTDINPYACQASLQTVLQACQDGRMQHPTNLPTQSVIASKNLLAIMNADLATPIRTGLIDVLIFNPPYVPTSDLPNAARAELDCDGCVLNIKSRTFKNDSHLLALSYAGGANGMEVTQRLLDDIPRILCPKRGIAYVLLCKQNNPDELIKYIHQWGPGWSVSVVGRSGKTGGWERLQILRIGRVQSVDVEAETS